MEGRTSAQWIALDYGDVIVHVFDEETRDYYDWTPVECRTGVSPCAPALSTSSGTARSDGVINAAHSYRWRGSMRMASD